MTYDKRPPRRVAIIGAGLTGLTAALRLSQMGDTVKLFEAAQRVGGAIRTEIADGWLVESGPNSLLAGDPRTERLLDELELDSELVPANPAARKRYILRGDKPRPLPLSPLGLMVSRLFSTQAKFRILGDLFRRPITRNHDLTIEKFIRHHFGTEAVTYALNPFVTGVYAGDPRKLSARYAFPTIWHMEKYHGSLIRSQIKAARDARKSGRRRGIVSFKRGLQTLPNAIAAQLPQGTLNLGSYVHMLIPGPTWTVKWNDNGKQRTDTFDRVIAAMPAHALARLEFGVPENRPLASLDTIDHPPLSSLFLGFRRDQVAHPLDGFGLLVPEVERCTFLGVLFSSTLFPHRAPENHVALTIFVGGVRRPEFTRMRGDELLCVVMPDLRRLLGVRGDPVFQRFACWPRAIPQYNIGYEHHFEAMEEVERRNPGFYAGGQARDGISLPSCIAGGERLAGYIY